MPRLLQFGIESLDWLIEPKSGDDKSQSTQPMTASLVGPDGVGKSVLALHLASWYRATTRGSQEASDTQTSVPSIFYVSTDLSYSQACRTWREFGLFDPCGRDSALNDKLFTEQRLPRFELDKPRTDLGIFPQRIRPYFIDPASQQSDEAAHANQLLPKADDLTQINAAAAARDSFVYLDLAEDCGGDDWSFVQRVIGLLPKPKDGAPPHLMIIDAIEGMEAMMGEIDSHGQRRTRRGRVAQLIRAARRAHCHLVFVIEEPELGKRLPEEFVADLVVRLRSVDEGHYTRRTIEIEKARGVAHIRGQHDLAIRDGKGTKTCYRGFNADQPEVKLPKQLPVFDRLLPPLTMKSLRDVQDLDYVHVQHSLHSRNRQLEKDQTHQGNDSVHAESGNRFGLDLLDDLFQGVRPSGDDGRITVLHGDQGTHKSRLGKHFLQNGFKTETETEPVAGVLICSYPQTRDQLQQGLGVSDADAERLLVRRIPAHHLTSAGLVEIVERQIWQAQRKLELKRGAPESERHRVSRRIRVVIDDWNTILATHPMAAADPLLLQAMLDLLRHEGVTALFIATQPGSPEADVPTTDTHPHELSVLDVPRVLTWPVEFFGERRVAITVMPQLRAEERPVVYELKVEDQSNQQEKIKSTANTLEKPAQTEASGTGDGSGAGGGSSPPASEDGDSARRDQLIVSRHFELYAELTQGRATRVPLQVRLYGGYQETLERTKEQPPYFREVGQVFAELFIPAEPSGSVLDCVSTDSYRSLGAFVELLDNARLDRTVVFQIDEFWENRLRKLADLTGYLTRPTAVYNEASASWVPNKVEDPRVNHQPDREDTPDSLATGDARFQPSVDNPTPPERRIWRRWRSFNSEYYPDGAPVKCDRVPYLWDFGLILARRDLWWEHREAEIFISDTMSWIRVGDVWNSLVASQDEQFPLPVYPINPAAGHLPVSWSEFFQACQLIRGTSPRPTFDLDMSPETLNSLVLEIWGSEIELTRVLGAQAANQADPEQGGQVPEDTPPNKLLADVMADTPFGLHFAKNRRGLPGASLRSLLRIYWKQLFRALYKLYNSISPATRNGVEFEWREASDEAVAARHWYSTAAVACRRNPQLVPLRLPGSYSTRGDWFLAVAAGSRSQLLAEQVIDILTSRRWNLLRLHDGIGLPARSILRPNDRLLRTGLTIEDFSTRKQQPLLMGDLKSRLAKIDPHTGAPNDFNWLWRSQIDRYSDHTFYFTRWLCRVHREFNNWMRPVIGNSADPQLVTLSFDDDSDAIRQDELDNIKQLEITQQAPAEMLQLHPHDQVAFGQFFNLVEVLNSVLREPPQ